MSITLTREELTSLTGTKQPKRMAEWLHVRGWVYEPARGRGDFPKVDRAYYLARMSGRVESPRRVRPNLDWMAAR